MSNVRMITKELCKWMKENWKSVVRFHFDLILGLSTLMGVVLYGIDMIPDVFIDFKWIVLCLHISGTFILIKGIATFISKENKGARKWIEAIVITLLGVVTSLFTAYVLYTYF